ncbi:hypothetical protein Ancab_039733 [Ancistrocladus abbreviatus]
MLILISGANIQSPLLPDSSFGVCSCMVFFLHSATAICWSLVFPCFGCCELLPAGALFGFYDQAVALCS